MVGSLETIEMKTFVFGKTKTLLLDLELVIYQL